MLRKLSALLVVVLATAVSLYSQGNLLINDPYVQLSCPREAYVSFHQLLLD